MPGSSMPRLFSAKIRARPTVAGSGRKSSSAARAAATAAVAAAAGSVCPSSAFRHGVERVEDGLAAERGLAAGDHRIAGRGDEAREIGDLDGRSALRRLRHRHQAGGEERAVGRARGPGEGLRAAEQRLAEIVGQVRRRLGDQRHAAGHRHPEVAVAERPVGGVEPVEIRVHRRLEAVDRRQERGAVDAHRTLQKAQSQGARR